MYSQCQHGPTRTLIDHVLPLMKKYRATGYIAGHDHCSGHYEQSEEPDSAREELVELDEAASEKEGSHRMAFVLAGAGKECCYRPSHLHSRLNPGPPLFRMDSEVRHGSTGGFASYVVSETSTTIRYHAQDGSVLYTAAPLTPRARTQAA